jgi:hypothetical protein
MTALVHHRGVIIWLNGPFGVGKTTTARALVQQLRRAMIFDPEVFGIALRHTVADFETTADFQDLRAWPALVFETARVLHTTYARTLIVPLTVLDPAAADALAAGLARVDSPCLRFRLIAPEAVLRARILDRPDAEGPHTWCLDHLEAGLRLMSTASFGAAVPTQQRSPEDVARFIAAAVAATRDEPRVEVRPTLQRRQP